MTARDKWGTIQATLGTATDRIPGPKDDAAIADLRSNALEEYRATAIVKPSATVIATIGGKKVYRDGSRIYFTAGMTINADGSPRAYHPNGRGLDYLANAGGPGYWWGIAVDSNGKPYVQRASDPAPGYYVSTTALTNPGYAVRDPRRYVDSEKVPFIVIPGGITWAKLGQKARVTYGGKTVDAIVADIGPAAKIGEGSIALANALGIPSDPKRGGVTSGVKYEILT